jgi:hypothetical protein
MDRVHARIRSGRRNITGLDHARLACAMLLLGYGSHAALAAHGSAHQAASDVARVPHAAGNEVPSGPAEAASGPTEPAFDRWHIQTSVHTIHFHPDPAHNNHQHLIDVSWRFRPQWLVGAAVFDNSFGQASQYVYAGWMAHPFPAASALAPFYFKLTGGLVHGYKEPYRDKIPFNKAGVAPVIIPSFGYCFRMFCSELVLFGNAGATLTFGVTFP